MRRAILLFVFSIFAYQGYGQTKDTESATVSFRPAPLFFKRADLTDEQVALIEEEREINNLNIMLKRPVNGQEIAIGSLDSIQCADGRIYFKFTTGSQELDLTAARFGDVEFIVLTPGTRAFTFRCGGRFPAEKVAAIYRPAMAPGVGGTLASLTFVPSNFRLKDLAAMAREPLIIIEGGTKPTDVETNIRQAEAERAEMERVTREALEREKQNTQEPDDPETLHDPGS